MKIAFLPKGLLFYVVRIFKFHLRSSLNPFIVGAEEKALGTFLHVFCRPFLVLMPVARFITSALARPIQSNSLPLINLNVFCKYTVKYNCNICNTLLQYMAKGGIGNANVYLFILYFSFYRFILFLTSTLFT